MGRVTKGRGSRGGLKREGRKEKGEKEEENEGEKSLHFVAMLSHQYFYSINEVNIRWMEESF